MKKILVLLTLLVITFTTAQAQKKHKIVFQMATADSKEQASLTRQINNVLVHWPNAEIEVVTHSAALEFMMKDKSPAEAEIKELMTKGVTFAVCQNTMKRKNVTETEIIDGAVFVPVGIAEIVLKQEKKYQYIKAGY